MRRLPFPVRTAVLVATIVAGWPAAVPAQEVPPADLPPPLRVNHVQGDVLLLRDGGAVEPEVNAPLIEGDRVRTTSGRAELGLPRGAVIFIDRHTTVDLRAANRLRLIEGRLRLASPGSAEPPDVIIDGPGATVTPSSVTAFVLEATVGPRGDEVVLTVDEGVVELAGDRGTTLVRAGESASLRAGGAPTPATGYTRAERNEFDIWVNERLRGYQPPATTAETASYLPDDLGSYRATLGRYGSWDYEDDYGYVWYPSVTTDWRPYSVGRWDRVGAYGWYWIGADPWAWPTHHYGRWGYRAGRWFWAPRLGFAPAWVSWSIGPGYVGWCPLGYDDQPVFGFGVGFSSWGGSYYYRGRPYYDRYDYWRGWSVLSSDSFYGRRSYGRDYLDARRLPREVTSAFVTQRRAPAAWGGGNGRYAVPRYGTPRGPWGGSGIGDTRVDSPRGPAYGGVGPGFARPRGDSTTGAEPYERAQPFMDRRNVPGQDAGVDRSPGSEPYERARPYMNRRYTPGTSPSDGLPSTARPRSGWGTTPQTPVPRAAPRGDTPRSGEPPRYTPRAPGSSDPPRYTPRAPGSSDPGSRAVQPRNPYLGQAPRSLPGRSPDLSSGPGRSGGGFASSPRSSAPRVAAPRSAPSRSFGGGGSPSRTAPRGNSGGSSSGSPGRSSPRSRSPRG